MMIRAGASDGGRWLHDIQPVHFRRFIFQFAAAVKFLHVADVARPLGHKIRVQRQDDLSLFWAVDSIEVTSKGHSRTFTRAVIAVWFPLMPFSFGIQLG